MSDRKFLTVDYTTNDVIAKLSFHNLTAIIIGLFTLLGAAYYWQYQLQLTQEKLQRAERNIERLEQIVFSRNVKGVSDQVKPTKSAMVSATISPTKKVYPTYTITPTRGAGE